MVENQQTIYIIDDEEQVCNSLKWLFESVQLFVKTYKNAHLFLEQYNSNMQGCIIIDVRLPGMSGLELLEHLKSKRNRIPVIVFTGYGDIPMAIRAMKAGAFDFIQKPFNDQFFLETVQKSLQQAVNVTSLDIINKRISTLSDRELQICHLILDGKLNKEIAYELSLSISTVEAHRASIMHKMQAKNLAQFIKMYVQSQCNTAFA
ncbi:TPA: response regulator transcription factor [Legionella pneumophila]|nr:response regulator transcription factor [Legionella pneumophila]HAU1061151.1 response regulator transcription factor [Legionella pneumophila]HAU1232814.1 response regulator transcription factor [Legionella pneumophila]HAU1368036.1 response regulator transcription factor [Legionella pneumophila]HAU2000837.1 response regulator transcription factor [Legionella pneumophila]